MKLYTEKKNKEELLFKQNDSSLAFKKRRQVVMMNITNNLSKRENWIMKEKARRYLICLNGSEGTMEEGREPPAHHWDRSLSKLQTK